MFKCMEQKVTNCCYEVITKAGVDAGFCEGSAQMHAKNMPFLINISITILKINQYLLSSNIEQ